ncbi:MAG: hypothetical protein M3P18_20510 [Actinomycetota bacterium]|nr:hypothetical protein [Actinomycetota bacterium]
MTRHSHPTLERIVRWLKPSAESFAAAAASPDLMLQPEATPGAVEEPPSPECDGRSREIGRRRRGAIRCPLSIGARTLTTFS